MIRRISLPQASKRSFGYGSILSDGDGERKSFLPGSEDLAAIRKVGCPEEPVQVADGGCVAVDAAGAPQS